MSFRDKEKRRGPRDKRTTIDAVHQDKVNSFLIDEKTIPNKNKELINFKKEYSLLDSKLQIDLSDRELQKKLQLQDTIKITEKELIKLKNKTDRTDYYLQNGGIIYQYYDNKYNSTDDVINTNKDSIINLFQKNQEKKVTKKNKDPEKKISKSNILNKYMSYIDDEYLYNVDNKEILQCKCGGELYLLPIESIMLCKECGLSEEIIINSDKPSYKDPPREVSYFAYKRINHFNEWLAQFQAKESTEIPEHVYNDIISEIKKLRIVNMSKLTPDKMREILKKHKLNKYYEHVPHIINKLSGLPPPIMNREIEEKLRSMFKEIQEPFLEICPKDRKNFLSYSYVLHKMCELLGLDEFLNCFPLLKSREKLHNQDIMWKQITHKLNWQFIPSI